MKTESITRLCYQMNGEDCRNKVSLATTTSMLLGIGLSQKWIEARLLLDRLLRQSPR